jgi:phosphomannomutase
VAQAFCDYARTVSASPAVAIGFDGRKSSHAFARIFASVLEGNGMTYYLSGCVIPTPVLSYFVKARQLDFGVMITASHNPPEYNGIKFKASYGGPFFTEETHKVEALIGTSEVKRSHSESATHDLLSPYKEHLQNIVDFKTIARSSITVAVDSMSGAGGTLIQDLLSDHGCKAETIFGIPNETFSGRLAEPIEQNLLPLRTELRSHPYSFGVATDGDADRLGVLLDTGDWLSSQETIVLLADFLKNGKNISGDIIKTSSVTNLLQTHFGSAECTVHDVQVGFKYICEKMMEMDAAFGAEESGGYGFKGHIPERDGILSALLCIEMLASSPYTLLSDYVRDRRKRFGEIFYDRVDLAYHGDDRNDLLPLLERTPPFSLVQFPVTSIGIFYSSRGIINGLKFYLEGSARWLLLRSSETEPLIRIYAEGQSPSEVQQILQSGIALIAKKT